MKIACNYYRETEALVQNGAIDIDYFKWPALGFQMDIARDREGFERFTRRLRALRPILLHGLFPAPHNLLSPSFEADFDAETAAMLIKVTGTPGLSLHPTTSPVDSGLCRHEIVKTIADNIVLLRSKLPSMAFLAIENVDSPKFGALLKPEVMGEITDAANCDFLLDISHAFCASRCIGEDFTSYLRRLPLHRVCEIHINGWVEQAGKAPPFMCHIKITEEGYRTLETLLELCEPKIITIEYGRDNDRFGLNIPLMAPDRINPDAEREIVEQVDRIRALVNR